jgi:hypothetical protein
MPKRFKDKAKMVALPQAVFPIISILLSDHLK